MWARFCLFVGCWTCEERWSAKNGSVVAVQIKKPNKRTWMYRQNDQIWCYNLFECPKAKQWCLDQKQLSIWHWHNIENILSLSTHNIFQLIPDLDKKQVSNLRLLWLGSDNGHVVKHWFKTIKTPHVRGMQASHCTCNCPMARLLVHFYTSQLTCC